MSSDAPQGRTPATISATAVPTTAIQGRIKLRRTERREVERHASSGPTPVRKSRKMPIGTATRLKKGGPIVTFDPCTYSLRTGKSVPQRKTKQATRSTRLLKRKLDSRETMDSRRFSLLRWSRCLKKVKRQTIAMMQRKVVNQSPMLLCAKA